MIDQSTRLGRVHVGVVALGLALGLGAAACKGGKTKSPAECMNECEQTCPFVADGMGDNDEYLECLEACQTKCGG